jgi:hypothetical protein
MGNQTEQEVSKSTKQKLFEAGTKFRINTQRSSTRRYFYKPDIGLIQDTNDNYIGEVLEINNFSVKLRVDILGQYEAVWSRFETFIFDAI